MKACLERSVLHLSLQYRRRFARLRWKLQYQGHVNVVDGACQYPYRILHPRLEVPFLASGSETIHPKPHFSSWYLWNSCTFGFRGQKFRIQITSSDSQRKKVLDRIVYLRIRAWLFFEKRRVAVVAS